MSNDYFNPPNSIWPNGLKRDEEGYVTFYAPGTNKVEVPTSSSEWPKGNKLVSPFVYQDDKLVGFVDTKALTTDSQTLIYLPYEHIEVEFSAIDKGQLQIHAPNAITKKASWKDSGVEDIPEVQFKYKGCKTVDEVNVVDPNYDTNDIVGGAWYELLYDLANGNKMFYEKSLSQFKSELPNLSESYRMFMHCENLAIFTPDLPSLTDGRSMFAYCSNLTSFDSNLPSLTNGKSMFVYCSNLTSFLSDLSTLIDGGSMFGYCSNLTSFDSNLPSLTNGKSMFFDCSKLPSFTSDLPSLTDGTAMFKGCTNLTSFSSSMTNMTNAYSMFMNCDNLKSFSSDLSSLTDGQHMFSNCSNLTSFSSDLRSLTDGRFMFYNCKLDAPSVKNIIDTINTYSAKLALGMGCNDTTEDKGLFAQEVGYTDMTSLLAALTAKGWTVTTQYKGRPTTTYSLRRPSENTLPVFAKLEETEKYANYISADSSKKYMLDWFHETTGSTEGYTQFNTLEEAIEYFNIKPIERN